MQPATSRSAICLSISPPRITSASPASKDFDIDKNPNTPLIPAPVIPKEVPKPPVDDKKPLDKQPPPKVDPPKVDSPVKAVRHQGEGRIYDKASGFSIALPKGWQQQ